ncbi:hypothetical protein ACTWP5_20845 [Streptomyces sp. 4N509B]|uniref:hypothetical protein n=1 Tax=Streptomyces sp. 4N509B TaxID=3457413 RepID=UPI003FD62980
MVRRRLGAAVAAVAAAGVAGCLALSGAQAAGAQAAGARGVTPQDCEDAGGTVVEYGPGFVLCRGGAHDGTIIAVP